MLSFLSPSSKPEEYKNIFANAIQKGFDKKRSMGGPELLAEARLLLEKCGFKKDEIAEFNAATICRFAAIIKQAREEAVKDARGAQKTIREMSLNQLAKQMIKDAVAVRLQKCLNEIHEKLSEDASSGINHLFVTTTLYNDGLKTLRHFLNDYFQNTDMNKTKEQALYFGSACRFSEPAIFQVLSESELPAVVRPASPLSAKPGFFTRHKTVRDGLIGASLFVGLAAIAFISLASAGTVPAVALSIGGLSLTGAAAIGAISGATGLIGAGLFAGMFSGIGALIRNRTGSSYARLVDVKAPEVAEPALHEAASPSAPPASPAPSTSPAPREGREGSPFSPAVIISTLKQQSTAAPLPVTASNSSTSSAVPVETKPKDEPLPVQGIISSAAGMVTGLAGTIYDHLPGFPLYRK